MCNHCRKPDRVFLAPLLGLAEQKRVRRYVSGCRWAQLDAAPGQPEEDSAVHKMAMNIGRRPSIEDGTDITVEVHILHSFAAADFRGQQLRVIVGGFIRHASGIGPR
jgi:FAD synthase